MMAAFAGLTVTELPKSGFHVLAVVVSAVIMAICLFVARRLDQPWLREWALGFSIIGGLIAAYIATN